MFSEKVRRPIILKPLSQLTRSCSAITHIIETSVRTQIKFFNSMHHSQKKLQLITNSNFVITKHKPTSNPYNDTRMLMRGPAFVRKKILRPKGSMNLKPKPLSQTFDIPRKNSISGWN